MPALTSGSITRSRDEAADAGRARRGSGRLEIFPAGLVASIETPEFDEFNQFARGWSSRQQVIGAATCLSSVFLVATPSMQLVHVRHAMGYSSQGENPAGMLSLVVPVDDARPMAHRGHGIDSLQLGLTRSGEGFECICPHGVRFVVASVAREKAEQYAADVWHEPGLWRHSTDRGRFVDSASRVSYLGTCDRILTTVNAQPELLGDARAAALLEEKFLEGLFLNVRLAAPRASNWSRYRLARQAYRYLQDRADAAPSIREMCAASGASYATLERAFHETYGLTPKAMMKAMRLSGARRALLHPGPTTTVTAVALRWGFIEFGRFSVQYRQRYGEVPSETLRRVRGNPAVERV